MLINRPSEWRDRLGGVGRVRGGGTLVSAARISSTPHVLMRAGENETHMWRICILQIESAGVGPLIGAGLNYPSLECGFPFSLFPPASVQCHKNR